MKMEDYLKQFHCTKMTMEIDRYRKLQSFDQTGSEKIRDFWAY